MRTTKKPPRVPEGVTVARRGNPHRHNGHNPRAASSSLHTRKIWPRRKRKKTPKSRNSENAPLCNSESGRRGGKWSFLQWSDELGQRKRARRHRRDKQTNPHPVQAYRGTRFRGTGRRVRRDLRRTTTGGSKKQTNPASTIPGRTPPYPKKCYHLPEEQLKELKKYLKDLLERGFIVPSQSPIAAPVFSVGKADGSLRLVIDYRALSGISIKDNYPIPRVQDLISESGKMQWYSELDLQKGYYQAEVLEQDRWRTAFSTRYGTFEFTLMPFGLAGAPSTF